MADPMDPKGNGPFGHRPEQFVKGLIFEVYSTLDDSFDFIRSNLGGVRRE